jgi:hypothetical protein
MDKSKKNKRRSLQSVIQSLSINLSSVALQTRSINRSREIRGSTFDSFVLAIPESLDLKSKHTIYQRIITIGGYKIKVFEVKDVASMLCMG